MFPLSRMLSIKKCHCILFILVTALISFLLLAKKISLGKISNEANSRWSNRIEDYLYININIYIDIDFFFPNAFLNTKAALINGFYLIPLIVWTRELAVLKKAWQMSQPGQRVW